MGASALRHTCFLDTFETVTTHTHTQPSYMAWAGDQRHMLKRGLSGLSRLLESHNHHMENHNQDVETHIPSEGIKGEPTTWWGDIMGGTNNLAPAHGKQVSANKASVCSTLKSFYELKRQLVKRQQTTNLPEFSLLLRCSAVCHSGKKDASHILSGSKSLSSGSLASPSNVCILYLSSPMPEYTPKAAYNFRVNAQYIMQEIKKNVRRAMQLGTTSGQTAPHHAKCKMEKKGFEPLPRSYDECVRVCARARVCAQAVA